MFAQVRDRLPRPVNKPPDRTTVPAMTLDVYAGLSPDDLDVVAGALDALGQRDDVGDCGQYVGHPARGGVIGRKRRRPITATFRCGDGPFP